MLKNVELAKRLKKRRAEQAASLLRNVKVQKYIDERRTEQNLSKPVLAKYIEQRQAMRLLSNVMVNRSRRTLENLMLPGTLREVVKC